MTNGAYLLNGRQVVYYSTGRVKWERRYSSDGAWSWLRWDESGRLISSSTWRGKKLISIEKSE